MALMVRPTRKVLCHVLCFMRDGSCSLGGPTRMGTLVHPGCIGSVRLVTESSWVYPGSGLGFDIYNHISTLDQFRGRMGLWRTLLSERMHDAFLGDLSGTRSDLAAVRGD